MFWSAGCSLLKAEGFSCDLCVLYGGLRISKFVIFDPKNIKKFYRCNFFPIFGHQSAWFGTGSGSAIRKNAGSGSALNQCGSTTLSWCPVPVPTQLADELFGLEPPELENPLGVACDNLLVESIRGHPSQAILQNIIMLLNMITFSCTIPYRLPTNTVSTVQRSSRQTKIIVYNVFFAN